MNTRQTLIALGLLLCAAPAAAQRRNVDLQIREHQERLDSIRQERASLESELRRLRGRARDINTEIANLGRQRTSTRRLINELDHQLGQLGTQVDTMTLELILVEDALAEKQAVVRERAVAIYKRGSLWAFQVLLAAESFGDLVSRYKYLFVVSRQDRALVDEITTLRDRIASHRRDLVMIQQQMTQQRGERDEELQRYSGLERDRQRALSATQQTEQRTQARIDELARDDERLNDLIAALERSRRGGPSRIPVSTITASDQGRLDWPAFGEVIYRFGQQPFRDRTSITRQGIGIRVPEGTNVTAVRTGIVLTAGPFGTWGNVIILNHGDAGYYTVYTYLSDLLVSQGDLVNEGQVIGLSGGASTDEGPHLGFQIRQQPPGNAGPIPLDPLNWLKSR